MLINLLDYDRRTLETWFTGQGEKTFRAVQLIRWLHHEGVSDFDAMTNLSKTLRESLKQTTCIRPPDIISEQTSVDGTRKWLLRVDDHNSVEMVFIPESDRGTLCISSQVGCALDCSFCSTGKQGYSRNLGIGEIIGQLWLANQRLPPGGDGRRAVTNVVFMGMGEPLLNYDNVTRAIEVMLDDNGYNLARKRVTVSTAGLVPQMDRLAVENRASLAVSLHAPNDALRDELVPINRSYPLAELLAACQRFVAARKGEPVTFEYVMLDGVNDGPAEARELVRRLADLPAKVNLIPFNRFPGTVYRCSPLARINQFREILLHGGLVTVTRKTRGDDIDAACGQLVGRVLPRAKRHQSSISLGH